jgi:hypothetical protein
MRYDKSLKLLNYASFGLYDINTQIAKLRVFTELDHSFVVGDKLYIVGGYYDNCNSKLYSTGNFYAANTTGYEVLAIIDSNSFILDIDVDFNLANPFIYPYGVPNNEFGDPFDNTDKAYNCYTTSMEKGVYISTTAFTRGIMKKGTINNGIFGNDYHKVLLNNKGPVSGTVSNADLIINHMVGKNIEISKGQINSKTDASNLASSKMRVLEDSTIGGGINPFMVVGVTVTNNNDGWGNNVFERITNTATDIIINNGIFSNANNSFIALNNISITKAKLGGNCFIKSLANQIDNVSLGTGYVGAINTLNDKIIVTGGIVNTFIPLTLEVGNATPVAYSATLKQIDIQVEYDVLANRYTAIGDSVYITGITGTGNFDLSHLTGTIAAMSYTFGTINSAVISIVFNIPGVTTGGDWTTWKAANPVTNYDFSGIKIHQLQNTFEAGRFENVQLISSYFDSSINFTTPDLYFSNSTVREGYFKGVTISSGTSFQGLSKGISAYITGCAQIDQDADCTYTYARIYNNLTPLRGAFNTAYIQKGIIHNSLMIDTVCIPPLSTDVIFLYMCNLQGMMYLDNNVQWDYLRTKDITLSTITGATTLVPGAYLGNGRYTPWQIMATSPLGIPPEYSPNINKLEGLIHNTSSSEIYHTQSIAKSSNSSVIGLPTNLVKKIEVPSSQNIQNPLTTTGIIAVVDNGSLSLAATNWGNTLNRHDVLYAEFLSTGTLDTKIGNRNSSTTLPGNDADFPFVNQGPSYKDLNTIDSNYIYTFNNYFKPAHTREASEIRLNIYEASPLIAPYDNQFPDPNTAGCLTTNCKIQGAGTYTVAPASTTAISNGVYNQVFLKVVGNVKNNLAAPASSVPQCFIEVERVFLNTWTTSFGAITTTKIFNINQFVQGNNLTSSTPAAPLTNYEFNLVALPGGPISFLKTITNNIEIIIDYWVTWYYYETGYSATADGSGNGYGGGARTKVSQTFRFN